MIVPQESDPGVMSVGNMIVVAIILLISAVLVIMSVMKSFKKK